MTAERGEGGGKVERVIKRAESSRFNTPLRGINRFLACVVVSEKHRRLEIYPSCRTTLGRQATSREREGYLKGVNTVGPEARLKVNGQNTSI